jgi:hypothetical protein
MIEAEQTIQIIKATSEASKNDTNYGWLLMIATIAIIPAMIKIFWRKK